MTGPASLEVVGSPEQVAVTRTFVAGILRVDGWDEPIVAGARLVTSELVAASIEAGATAVAVSVSSEAGRATIDVTSDAASTPPLPGLVGRVVHGSGDVSRRPGGWRLVLGGDA